MDNQQKIAGKKKWKAETESRIRSLKKILLALFLFAYGIGSVMSIGRMLYGKNKATKKRPSGQEKSWQTQKKQLCP